jgi:hypothetical protein
VQICIIIHGKKIDKTMKKQIYNLMTVLVLGSFTVKAQSLRQTSTNVSNGGVNATAGFENKKVLKTVKTEDFNTYAAVNNLYQTNGVKFVNLNETEKEAFTAASNSMINKLSRSRKTRNQNAAKVVKGNKAIFEVIWMSQNIANNELVELPVSSENYTSL